MVSCQEYSLRSPTVYPVSLSLSRRPSVLVEVGSSVVPFVPEETPGIFPLKHSCTIVSFRKGSVRNLTLPLWTPTSSVSSSVYRCLGLSGPDKGVRMLSSEEGQEVFPLFSGSCLRGQEGGHEVHILFYTLPLTSETGSHTQVDTSRSERW